MLKHIAGAIAGIFFFFAEAYRTQKDWQDMQDEKKTETETKTMIPIDDLEDEVNGNEISD